MKESSLVTYKNQIIQVKRGEADFVDFDFEMVWHFIKREEDFEKGDLHFFHLHPFATAFYSMLDEKCAKALSLACGFPVNFWILTLHGDDGLVTFNHYKYDTENDKMELIISYANFGIQEGSFLCEHELYNGLTFGLIDKILYVLGTE
jgi:hypothetical protein